MYLEAEPDATAWQVAKHLHPRIVDGKEATLEALHQRVKRRLAKQK